MRSKMVALLVFSMMFSSLAWPATKTFSFTCRTKIVRGDEVSYEYRTHTYQFQARVQMDHFGTAYEQNKYGHSFVQAQPNARYSVVIYNPMPVRVAVNLTIDGLNSVTGSPCTPASGTKWLLEPYATTTIQGWQVSGESLRRFYFTTREESYSQWRSHQLGKDLTVKCGQIVCSYFWSKADMERYFEYNPIVEYPPMCEEDSPSPMMGMRKKSEIGAPQNRDKAGTGMGEKKWNPVQNVHFHYDMGMYREWDSLKIYYDFYDFYKPHPRPMPMPWKKRYQETPEFAPEQED